MTTILANRSQMAADTFDTDGGRSRKIYEGNGFLIGESCADIYYSARLIHWVLDGNRGPAPEPADSDEKEGSLLILRPAGLFTLDWHGVEVLRTNEFFAVGSGSEYALGAMAAGASLEQALAIAAEYDEATKPPFIVVDLPKRRKK